MDILGKQINDKINKLHKIALSIVYNDIMKYFYNTNTSLTRVKLICSIFL